MYPGVKRCGYLAEQQAGGLGIQRYRQVPGAGISVQLGNHRWQRGRCGRRLFPGVALVDDYWVVGVLSECDAHRATRFRL